MVKRRRNNNAFVSVLEAYSVEILNTICKAICGVTNGQQNNAEKAFIVAVVSLVSVIPGHSTMMCFP